MNPRDPHYPNRAEWLTRPARKQVDDATLQKEIQARGGLGERNFWSGRRIGPSIGPSGGDGKRSGPAGQRVKEASKYRCVLELDVGRTRGSDAKQHVFCLYFAKGCCSQGSACTYLHRLPTADDEAYAVRDLSGDIFGREKRAESEGYRSGAGTLDRDNRTLYVNYEGAGTYDLPKIRQLLDANFRVFGPVNNIYIVHNKTIAFVRYDWRSSAEFAKEAMHKQRLVGSTLGEVITARWANEDPNPVAVLAQKRACEEAFGLAVMTSFDALPSDQKQARIMELQLQSALQRGTSIGAYPSTDTQFAEHERQKHELELLRWQQQLEKQQQEAQLEAGGGNDDEEDIPYIPTDIYEEQQRLIAQQRDAGPVPGATAAKLRDKQDQGEAVGLADAGPGELYGAEGSTATTEGMGAEQGRDAGHPDWERAWWDPELREQMRNNPELRERMRRARNEAVYWSAYQAHYSAYANSYGHHTMPGLQEQQYPQLQQHGQEPGYYWEDYHGWYGQQLEPGAVVGAGVEEPANACADESAGPAREWSAKSRIVEVEHGDHDKEGFSDESRAKAGVQGHAGVQPPVAAGAEKRDQEGAKEYSTYKPNDDGLSLLGAAYVSDDEIADE